MQWKAARQLNDKRIGFLDPSLICQSAHDWPLKLDLKDRRLSDCKTKREKEEKIKALHHQEKQKVAMHVDNSLKFCLDSGRDVIVAPYNFE
jgi:hypothetical protein